MNLYVWNGFARNFSNGLAVALAKDEVQARKLIVDNVGYDPSNWGTLEILTVNKPFGVAVPGGS